eukprot:Hpha_TRINITY_DN25161_c0_g1::TRINITY_DN25161_c0_g1_i1::g.139300::m.139300
MGVARGVLLLCLVAVCLGKKRSTTKEGEPTASSSSSARTGLGVKTVRGRAGGLLHGGLSKEGRTRTSSSASRIAEGWRNEVKAAKSRKALAGQTASRPLRDRSSKSHATKGADKRREEVKPAAGKGGDRKSETNEAVSYLHYDECKKKAGWLGGAWCLKGSWPGYWHVKANHILGAAIGKLCKGRTLLDVGAGSGQYGVWL